MKTKAGVEVQELARARWRKNNDDKRVKKLKRWQTVLIATACVIGVIVIIVGSIAGALTAQLKGTGNTEMGAAAYAANVAAKKTKEYYQVYTADEIKENGTKAAVRLYRFPAVEKTAATKYVIICPGGGYKGASAQSSEGFPVAATFADMGYTAFVLEYRCGDNSFSENYSQIKDLAAAVKYVTANAEEFNVKTEDYAVCGFSAGGHIVSLYGTESVGYANYEAPKPAAIIMGYGLINVTNLQIEAKYVIGKEAKKADREKISTDLLVTAEYPPIYFWQAKNDILFGNCKYSNRLDKALTANGIEHKYEIFKTGQHTCGLGIGTSSEGWIYNAIAFWVKAAA